MAYQPTWTVDEATGDVVCQHGTAIDVHCCNCHSGFLFDSQRCVCVFDGGDGGEAVDEPTEQAA